MIRLEHLLENKDKYRLEYLLAKPFPHLIIDELCDKEKIEVLYTQIPELHNKSRDYVFAANKFEKSKFMELSPLFQELHEDLTSQTFTDFLRYITNQEIIVDVKYHGGGMHQGKQKSFLDMHLDFNYHPLKKNWFRTINILLYLNKDWKPEYGGHLKLQDLRNNNTKDIEVYGNRLVIQSTSNYTLHGYDVTHFPEGMYRTSIAAYGYVQHQTIIEKPRTTYWHVSAEHPVKLFLAKIYNPAVKIKNALFGSRTAKN